LVLSLATVACVALGASGCFAPEVTQPPKSKLGASSPVTQDVINAEKHPGPYPRFADIPNVPTDVRPASDWKAAAQDLEGRRARLDTQISVLPPPQTDTETFAGRSRSRTAGADQAPSPDSRDQTESYAKALRERATPPPPPK
jgi:hypothetical protein